MRILLLNVPNTLNYGSMLMAETLLNNIAYACRRDRQIEYEFVVLTDDVRETGNRLGLAMSGVPIKTTVVDQDEFFGMSWMNLALLAISSPYNAVRRLPNMAAIDAIVVLGGDDFTEDYGRIEPLLRLGILSAFVRCEKPVYMIGQSIGPFHSWRQNVAAYYLRNMTKVVARDPITYEYITQTMGVGDAILGADLGFLPLAHETCDNTVPFHKGTYVTVVPSELLPRYALEPGRARYIECLATIAVDCLNRIGSDISLVLLPHVLKPSDVDDRLAARDLAIALRRAGIMQEMIHVPYEPMLPDEARSILAGSYMVITGRMHGAVSALYCGVPTISLSYSRKYWGVIGESLGLHDLVIDVRHNTWSQVEHKVRHTVDSIALDYEPCCRIIRQRAAEAGSRAEKALLQVCQHWSASTMTRKTGEKV